ncbi:hypothetical protein RN346_04660 [Halomonas sp. PAMB 3232]|uniref:hypothetical protein n=1 Tax=Halomonas sp. PAMB 3232 TaxID=3075221 RepID=UPI002896FDB8|nr:hypothetical protein [Halomonas sp. PAMB 3232]WNL39853.1 hypothetical protein RN346_04660 [Halomonas sp. PAMB 3232]
MITYSDSEIEYYAERFVRMRIGQHGFNLAQYIANPATVERAALEPEPLLAAQHAAVLRIWQRWDTGLAAPGSETDDIEIQANGWDWRDFLDQLRADVHAALLPLDHVGQRNGTFIEPMRHHRHNHRNTRAMANFERKQARKGA